MKTEIYTPVTKGEYWELCTLGAKLPQIPNIPEYQVATIHAYRLYTAVYLQQSLGWTFWYTNRHETVEAFDNIYPLHFKFSHSNYWKKIELGEFDRNASNCLPFGLNFLAEAATRVRSGYNVRRSMNNKIEDATQLLGLDVYRPKPKLHIVKR